MNVVVKPNCKCGGKTTASYGFRKFYKWKRREDANPWKWTTRQSLLYAKLALGSLIDNIADTDCWQNFEKIRSYATIEASETISPDNALSQTHKSLLCIVRCYTQNQQCLCVFTSETFCSNKKLQGTDGTTMASQSEKTSALICTYIHIGLLKHTRSGIKNQSRPRDSTSTWLASVAVDWPLTHYHLTEILSATWCWCLVWRHVLKNLMTNSDLNDIWYPSECGIPNRIEMQMISSSTAA